MREKPDFSLKRYYAQWISRSQTPYLVGVNSKIRFFQQSLRKRASSSCFENVTKLKVPGNTPSPLK